MLRDYGDIPDLFAELKDRTILLAAPQGNRERVKPGVRIVEKEFSQEPARLLDWLRGK